jgi:hypothetical protein
MKINNKTNKNNILRRIFSFQKRYKKCLVNSSPLTLNKKKTTTCRHRAKKTDLKYCLLTVAGENRKI